MAVRRLIVAAALIAGGLVSVEPVEAQPKGGAPRPFVGGGGARPFPGPTNPVGQAPFVFHNQRNYPYYGGGFFGPSIGVGIGFVNGEPAFGAVSVGGGYGGFWGGTYNGFYTNGFTGYGPPVPTYGPIPGSFGGSDQRLNNGGGTSNWQPFGATAIFPLNDGKVQVQQAQPLPAFPQQRTEPSQIPATPLPDSNAPPLLPTDSPLLMDVTVPDGAKVFIDGKETKQAGTNRVFQSPDRKLGEELKYEIIAEWSDNGVPMRRVKLVVGKAGERVAVDFTKDE